MVIAGGKASNLKTITTVLRYIIVTESYCLEFIHSITICNTHVVTKTNNLGTNLVTM